MNVLNRRLNGLCYLDKDRNHFDAGKHLEASRRNYKPWNSSHCSELEKAVQIETEKACHDLLPSKMGGEKVVNILCSNCSRRYCLKHLTFDVCSKKYRAAVTFYSNC